MKPELIVMLTQNDLTVEDAEELFESCCDSDVKCWGFKEHPLPTEQMQRLCRRMKDCGKTTFLEVVAYSEEEGLKGAQTAIECGFDVLMGTCFHESINDYCLHHHLRYMPFAGEVKDRPSILEGRIENIVAEARQYVEKGAFGIDLLGYRYTGDARALCRAVVEGVDAPVCLAGSINSLQRIDEVMDMNPWAFTIGSAFFENKFGEGLRQQADYVYDYIHKER